MNNYDTDIIVVGAGIHGAAIASEACRNGHQVTLIEQFNGPAQGTSSKSSKLIHGGLRYLESFELSLVYECLADRCRLLNRYPDLVKLKKFYLPVYNTTSRPRHLIRAGLSLYALLGGLKESNRFRKLEQREWQALDGLSTDNLLDVFQYYDAQTNDAALTARLIHEAMGDSLQLFFNAKFDSCEYDEEHVSVTFTQDGRTSSLTAPYLINAAGPWVNQIIQSCQPMFKPLAIELIQGTHIEIPGKLQQGLYYLEAPRDKRAVFAMPWQDHILVGTTEQLFAGDPAECSPTSGEMSYLLAVYNHFFKPAGSELKVSDIINSWSGLRVLPKSEDKPFNRSRETIFLPNRKNNPNIFSIYGGKLTSHHSTALKLLKLLK